ncbi:hypothetical protein [Paenibacillus sp. FSL H8-0537]|uniref:hypothetical protein n=1 Tax=Paenibacillus sp. FSL H8-0537 TaxID=2921399 RepID=UPI0031012BCD
MALLFIPGRGKDKCLEEFALPAWAPAPAGGAVYVRYTGLFPAHMDNMYNELL